MTARCGYCVNLCDTCFKPAPVNPLTAQPPEEESDMSFKFCGHLCYNASVIPPKSDAYFLADEDGALHPVDSESTSMGNNRNIVPSCGPISDSHTVHLHSLCASTNWAGFLKLTELTVCSGYFKGCSSPQYYVMYRGRSLTGQQCLEFFVSDNLTPTTLLPHISDADASDAVQDLVDDEVVKQQLWEVIRRLCKGCSIDITQFNIPWLVEHVPGAQDSLFKGEGTR